MHRSTIFLLLGARVALTTAIPESHGWEVRSAEEIELLGLPIVDLTVTNDNFPGKTFTGTAESIYDEMKALKPELFQEWIEYSPSGESSDLEKRAGSVSCGWGNSIGSWTYCVDGLTHLMNLGTSWCNVGPSPGCARVACSRGCGIFLCNKLGHNLGVHCGDIPYDCNDIGSRCQNAVGSFSGTSHFNSHYIGMQRQDC